MQVFNATPLIIKGRAEGIPYVIGPGEIRDLQGPHAETLLTNYRDVGLRAIKHGDDEAAIQEEATACLCEHIEKNIREFNQMQMDLSRQGLKLLPPNQQLDELAVVLKRLTGENLHAVTPQDIDADPVESVIRSLAVGVKKLGDTPEARKLAAVLAELTSVRGTEDQPEEHQRAEILSASDLTGASGVARQRANLRHRQAGRNGKAAKGG